MLINWVALLSPLLERGGWHWGMDGMIRINQVAQSHSTPWLHAPVSIPGITEANTDCGLLTIYHNQVFQQKAVHSFCLECYKVVVGLASLKQVHKMAEWQHDCGYACKAGAERRNYTPRNWGAYFYCRGEEEGKVRFKEVRKWVDENLGEDVSVILKRGCTEFEQNLGDSDKWEKIPHQDEIEAEGNEVIDYKAYPPIQSDAIRHSVWDVWDNWDNQTRKAITYHEEED